MAYNPSVYNPQAQQWQWQQFAQQMQQPFGQVPQQLDNRIFVNGPTSALNFGLAPNSISAPLLDANEKRFYIVASDGSGMKSVQTFDYKPHEDKPEPTVEYATKADLEALAERIDALAAKPARTRKAAGDAE